MPHTTIAHAEHPGIFITEYKGTTTYNDFCESVQSLVALAQDATRPVVSISDYRLAGFKPADVQQILDNLQNLYAELSTRNIRRIAVNHPENPWAYYSLKTFSRSGNGAPKLEIFETLESAVDYAVEQLRCVK